MIFMVLGLSLMLNKLVEGNKLGLMRKIITNHINLKRRRKIQIQEKTLTMAMRKKNMMMKLKCKEKM